jgi:hypothetical protein
VHLNGNKNECGSYLNKLCYLSGESAYSIFQIAGNGIPKYMIERDFENYLKTDCLPSYVESFIEEGKQIIKDAPASPFCYWGI